MFIAKDIKKVQEDFSREKKTETLTENVRRLLKNYFSQLKGEKPIGVYNMVLAEVEVPLLEGAMKYTKNNQALTARMLGLSRGCLREKLKAYGLLNDKKIIL